MTAGALGIPVNKGSDNEAAFHGSAVGLLRHVLDGSTLLQGRETKAGGSRETIRPA